MAKKTKRSGEKYRVVMLSHGKTKYVQKKVVAMGKERHPFSDGVLSNAKNALGKSHDFIIGDDKVGGIRVYMVVGSNGKLKVLASTFGPFRECMAKAKWTVSETSKINFDEARRRDEVENQRRHVTPDQTITFECEACGHINTVRVGKKLV